MIIGITGGIGSGKSTIAKELSRRGFAVYDCDREAKRIIAENKDVQQQIINLFGEKSFINGIYNTQYISKCVFSPSLQGRSGEALRAQLNAIIHPAVKADILSLPSTGRLGGAPVLFIESAILVEAGLDTICDKIVVIEAPEEVRIARTIERDYGGVATEENINKVRARIRAQKTPATKEPQGKYYRVTNDGRLVLSRVVDLVSDFATR